MREIPFSQPVNPGGVNPDLAAVLTQAGVVPPLLPSAPAKAAPPVPTLLDQARAQFPRLQDLDVGYHESFGARPGFLEFWPPGEPGGADYARPSALPLGRPGLEIYDPATRPIDVAGDLVSHQLVETDPKIKHFYQMFAHSLTPKQEATLKQQYEYAQLSAGETRPFAEWKARSGLPAYFRGYAFDQWQDAAKYYEPGQLKLFDQMLEYLRQEKPGTKTERTAERLYRK